MKQIEGVFLVWIRGLSATYAVKVDTEHSVMPAKSQIIGSPIPLDEMERRGTIAQLMKDHPCPVVDDNESK